MPTKEKKNHLPNHVKVLKSAIGDIQTTLYDTPNIPVSELVKLQKKYMETQEALKLMMWLEDAIKNAEELEKENEAKIKEDKSKSKIITMD